MTKTLIVNLFTVFFSFVSFACTVDVTILEGTSISFCPESGGTINASPGFVAYAWTGPQTGSTASLTPTVSGQYVVTAIDGIGCVSTATIDVIVYPAASGTISSSEGLILCPSSAGSTLSTTPSFTSYLWSTGASSPSILVNQGGTYSCQFIDGNGCAGNAQITISVPNFSLNPTGTVNVCEGSAATLIATGGGNYLWSTGETGSTIVVSPTLTTNYSVTITNGSCVETLSQTVTFLDMPIDTIKNVFYIAPGEVVFINGPDDYESYTWSPQDYLSTPTSQGTVYNGMQTATYNVASISENGCMRNDMISIYLIELTIPNAFSPNNDGYNDLFVVPELELYKGKIAVFNRWGDKVFESDHYMNDWDGRCRTSFCMGQGDLPEGTYFFSIDVEHIHFDGYITLKR